MPSGGARRQPRRLSLAGIAQRPAVGALVTDAREQVQRGRIATLGFLDDVGSKSSGN